MSDHDLRMPLLALAAWCGALVGGIAAAGTRALTAAIGLLAVGVLARALSRRGRDGAARLLLAAALLSATVGGGLVVRTALASSGPVASLAAERAVADVVGTVVGDPRRVEGRYGVQVVVRVRLGLVEARGRRVAQRVTITVLGDPAWTNVALGERVRARGRLAASDDRDAALLTGATAPTVLERADPWWRAAGAVRAAVRRAVEHRPAEQAALVPALVDGDDAALPDELVQDFRTAGLTHLTAVSGTNLTLVVGALLALSRLVGVRGRWLTLVGLAGIVGFVLLARTEPSVLRAAAMGVVGLFAFGPDGRRRGLRALGVAVVVLLLLEPALARSAGFALSTLATAGIVLLGPPLAESLARWLPVPLAQAIAVPTAAQLACTPVVAGLSGQVSLVAVAANLLVGPVVGPATVCGLLGGLLCLVADPVGRLFGTLAGWSVAWIVIVARHAADLPRADIPWSTAPPALALLTVLCLVLARVLPRLAGRRGLAVAAAATLALVVLGVPGRALPGLPGLPGRAWPPRDWAVVMCDVGQGDALVLAAGPGAAVVVDAGPDADAVDACLDDLGVRRIPLLVLTHFHADHVDGLAGALRGRRVDAVETTAVLDPPRGVRSVDRVLREAGVQQRLAPFGTTRRLGAVTFQVVHPDLDTPVPGAGDGSSANDASVVLLARTHGVGVLLTGDVEPPSQADLARLLPGLRVDVLKVPHHGSARQDIGWLASLRPRWALVSVGAGNDYGHPSLRVLDVLRRGGARVLRTDTDGAVALVVTDGGEPRVVTAR